MEVRMTPGSLEDRGPGVAFLGACVRGEPARPRFGPGNLAGLNENRPLRAKIARG